MILPCPGARRQALVTFTLMLMSEQGRGSFSIHRDTRQFVAGSFFGRDGAELRFRRVAPTPPTPAAR